MRNTYARLGLAIVVMTAVHASLEYFTGNGTYGLFGSLVVAVVYRTLAARPDRTLEAEARPVEQQICIQDLVPIEGTEVRMVRLRERVKADAVVSVHYLLAYPDWRYAFVHATRVGDRWIVHLYWEKNYHSHDSLTLADLGDLETEMREKGWLA